MIVNNKTNPKNILRTLLRDRNGMLLTSDLKKYNIPRTYLSILQNEGEIERIQRGVYANTNYLVDEMASLQARFKRAIFSHETALYLLDLSDRTPLSYSVSVPSGYNATSLKGSGAKVYFVNRGLYPLGLTAMKSPHGNEIQTYSLERTICDVLKSRNRIDIQIINEALKRYVLKKERNIDLLFSYAKYFRIQKILRERIEALL